MANKKDVTLVIKAQNEAKAEFEKLVGIVKKIEQGFDGSQDAAAELSGELNKLAASKGGQFFSEVEKDVSRLNQEYRDTQLRLKQIAAQRKAMIAQVGPFQPAKQKEYNRSLKASEKEMSRLQTKAGGLSAEYKRQLTLLRQMRATAGSANPLAFGSKLATAQASIAATAKRPGAGGLGELFKYDPSGPRQTLDFYQRLRGQVLAMTGAYIGLYGAANQFNKAIQEQVKTQGIRSRIGATLNTTDDGAITAEIEKLKQQAEELGQEFLPLADSFSKFSAAARLSGQSVAAVNTIFDNMTKAGTTLNLTGDEMGGVFLGLQQIFSKGKVTAEDFRGQVAERLPGAIPILARSMGVAQEALDKMFEQGMIGAEEMIAFSVEYQRNVEAGLIPATTNLRANLARLSNDTMELRASFMEGAEEGILAAIESLREAMKDPQFKQDVKSFGASVGSLAETLSGIAPYVPDMIKLLGVFVGFKALAGGVRIFRDLRRESGLLRKKLRKLTGASTQTAASLGKAGGLAGAFTKLGPLAVNLTRFLGPIGLAGAVAALAFNMREVSRETEGTSSVLANLLEGTRRTLDWSDDSGFGSFESGHSKPQPTDPRQALSRREEFERNRAEYLAEQNKKTDEQIALEEARANKVRSTTEALRQEVLALQKKADKETKINEQAKKDRESLRASFKATRRAIRATYEPGGVDDFGRPVKNTAERQRVRGELQAAREEYLAGVKAIEERVAQERAKIHERETKEREERERRNADLTRQIELQAIDPRDTDTLRHAKYEDEYRATLRQIEAMEGVDALEKKRLKNLADQRRAYAYLIGDEEALRQKADEAATAAQKLIEARDTRIQTITAEGAVDGSSESDMQKQIQQEYANTEEAIRKALQATLEFYQAVGDEQKVEETKQKLVELKKGYDAIDIKAQQLEKRFAGGLADGIVDFAKGAKSAKDALSDFASEFLTFIAKAIIQKQILNAIESGSGGGFFSLIAGLQHGGGIAGSANMSRSGVSAAAFMVAPRYHTGGIAGIKPDEVPAVLQKGEEVLTRNDPRHIMNGGGRGGAGSPPEMNFKFINAIDSDSVMNEAFSSPSTDKAFVNKFKANQNAIRQVLR